MLLPFCREGLLVNISILGSTGSIGTQALAVAKAHRIEITAIAAHSSVKMLEEQAREFSVRYVCVFNKDCYNDLKVRLADTDVRVLCGMDGLCEIARLPGVNTLVNAVVGMVGLLPTLTALENGTRVALANKETLVAGGQLVMALAQEKNLEILPIDSEHSAIFQSLRGNNIKQVNKIILTASGGPFFGRTRAQLEAVTVAQALNHPNWLMGSKITIDSATLMNKGLEFIEAMWLFDPPEIEVVVHRQSILHSAVEYKDFSIIAQLGVPDMKIPIQYALLYPERLHCPTRQLSLIDVGNLTFENADMETFTCLGSCITAIKKGGAYPAIVNGANEEAVKAFLESKISFLKIGELVQAALENFPYMEINSYSDVANADESAREFVLGKI